MRHHTEVTHEESLVTKSVNKTIPMSKEQMDNKVGPHKGQAWREAKGEDGQHILQHDPCPVTGLDTEFLRLWHVPLKWIEKVEQDLDLKSHRHQVELQKDEVEKEEVEVKKEKLTPEEQELKIMSEWLRVANIRSVSPELNV